MARLTRYRPLQQRDPAIFRVVHAFTLTAIALYVIFGGFSAYRAWVQVRSVDLIAPFTTFDTTVTVRVNTVSWSRTHVRVSLVLVQGTHSEELTSITVRSHKIASLDPRTTKGSIVYRPTADVLSHFQPGPAVLRAIALGRPQWMRTPPPVVREQRVVISERREH